MYEEENHFLLDMLIYFTNLCFLLNLPLTLVRDRDKISNIQ